MTATVLQFPRPGPPAAAPTFSPCPEHGSRYCLPCIALSVTYLHAAGVRHLRLVRP